jgi:hypothetical protein
MQGPILRLDYLSADERDESFYQQGVDETT